MPCQNNPEIITIMRGYRSVTNFHRASNSITDRFGFWEPEQFRPLPKYSEKSIHTASDERCKQLGYKNILWSGGIDSTYIVCTYIKNKVPFRVFYDYRSVEDGLPFLNWLKNHGYDTLKFGSIVDTYNRRDLLHGYTADLLFSPLEKFRLSDKSLYDNLENAPNRDYLFQKIHEYGRYLNKPTDTDRHIARLMDFGCFCLRSMTEFYPIICPIYKLTAFFDYSEFTDIAYTQYWDKDYTEGKPDMLYRIGEVTESEEILSTIHRHGTRIPARRLLTDDEESSHIRSLILDSVVNPI